MSPTLQHWPAASRVRGRSKRLNAQALRKELELRDAEVRRQQAEERARLADELERANRALAESNEQLMQFAYVASHDLYAPLRRVISYSELLQHKTKDRLDEKSAEYVALIVRSAQGMQTLISDLLTYSRVATHDQPREMADCSTVLSDVLTNLEVVIQETGATVTHDELPILPAYRSQLVQLLQNLIANAVNYRSEEPPRIHIAAQRGEGAWRFSVRDNGIGIDPQYHDQIFIMFKRLHGSERSGTGIGLATCRKIVERHGGRIWVESLIGQGSTFHFTIADKVEQH